MKKTVWKLGLVLALLAALLALGEPSVIFPKETQIGALAHYVSEGGIGSSFQPMNANFGIIEPLPHRVKGGKTAKNQALAERALDAVKEIKEKLYEDRNS